MKKTARMHYRRIFMGLLVVVSLAGTAGASAAETATLDMELNSLTTSENGCKVNFVMRNGLESAIDALSLEIVLFGNDGRIASILNLQVGELPLGKTRVKQFRFKSCADISRILINTVNECRGAGLAPKKCSQKLKTTNRTKVQFGS